MQLDGWWYPKGASQSRSASDGFYVCGAHPELFPNGLAAFQQSLGIPLVTHNRWLDSSSPYRNQYECSGNTVIGPVSSTFLDSRIWRPSIRYGVTRFALPPGELALGPVRRLWYPALALENPNMSRSSDPMAPALSRRPSLAPLRPTPAGP